MKSKPLFFIFAIIVCLFIIDSAFADEQEIIWQQVAIGDEFYIGLTAPHDGVKSIGGWVINGSGDCSFKIRLTIDDEEIGLYYLENVSALGAINIPVARQDTKGRYFNFSIAETNLKKFQLIDGFYIEIPQNTSCFIGFPPHVMDLNLDVDYLKTKGNLYWLLHQDSFIMESGRKIFGSKQVFSNKLPFYLLWLTIAGIGFFGVYKKKKYDLLFLYFLAIITLSVLNFGSYSLSIFGLGLLSIFAIVFGSVLFYKNRDRIESEIEQEEQQEKKAEQKRANEFKNKFPKINKIPVFRRIVKWMYKEGWWYSAGLFGITVLGAFLRLWNLGKLSFTTDEIYQGIAMKAILEHGVPLVPEGILYTRGLIQSYLGAFFALILGGPSEYAIRLPVAISGILTIPLLYLIGKETHSKRTGFVVAFLFTLYPWAIEFSRWGRMYHLITFLILLTFYSSIKAFKYNNIFFLVISLISILLSILTHEFGYITPLIFGGVYLVYHFNFIKIFNYKKIILLLLIPLLIPAAKFFVAILNNNLNNYSILSTYSFIFTRIGYSDYFLNFFIRQFFILNIGILFYIYYLLHGKMLIKENIILFLTLFFSILSLSYYHLHEASRYFFFITPFIFLIGIMGYQTLLESKLKEKFSKKTAIIVTIFTILLLGILFITHLNYSFSIPFRNHGDIYINSNFSPTLVSNYIADRRSNNQFLKEIMGDNDTIISNHYQFTYYYNREPDYYIRPGSDNYFCRFRNNNKDKCYMIYMNKTLLISAYEQFINIIENTTDDIYIIFNLEGGHQDKAHIITDWLNDYSPNNQKFEIIFIGDEMNSKVFKLKNVQQ